MSETAEGDGAVATEEGHSSLSASQLERIKRNREKARSIRQARLRSQPYDLNAVPWRRAPATASREHGLVWLATSGPMTM